MFAALILTCPQVCVKMCDPSKGAAGQKTVAVLLPCLLDKGIVSTVAEVRSLRLVSPYGSSRGSGLEQRHQAYSPEVQNILCV